MPVVQRLTLRQTIGDIPKGTQILVVTKSESDRSTSGILPALRKAGYTDDQFIVIEATSDDSIEDASNWEYMAMPEEDPGELNLSLSRFSQPIFTNDTFHGKNAVANRINVGNNHTNEPLLTGAYWDYWKRTTENFFWLFFIILFVLWIPFNILKFILKFAAWGFMNVLNIT